MSDTWEKVFRQVAHKGNVLITGTAAIAETNYTEPNIGANQLSQRAVEFPKSAVDDAILNACDLMLRLIGLNKNNPYRLFFAGITDTIISGQVIPIIDSLGKPKVGVIGTVTDVDNPEKKLKFVDYSKIENFNIMTIPIEIYWCNTDNFRLWHTRPNGAIADVVVWSKEDQRILMNTEPRGFCPFPEDLIEALVSGGLCYMFRNNFNLEQVREWKDTFRAGLMLIDKEWDIKLGQLDILE